MTLFVGGRLSATPVVLETSLSLQNIRSAMAELPYSGLPGTGWGSIEDPIEDVGKPGPGRPVMAKPSIHDALPERDYPERLLGRFYFDELDRRAMNRFKNADESALHVFRATDVAISSMPGHEGRYIAFIGMGATAPGFHSHVIPNMRKMLQDIDEKATILVDSAPVGFDDSDFFKWLLYRTINDSDLGRIRLDFIRHIDGQDGNSRGTAISGGADIDRPELLALVSASHTAFGPVKVRLNHEDLDLIVDVEIKFDGSFSVKTLDSVYGDETDLSKSDKSLRLIQDVAYRVIPELTSAWIADTDWITPNRAQFIADARVSLIKVLAPAVPGKPCKACGHTV